MPLAYWTHDLSPFLIRFTENIGIRWYGVSYMLGFLVAAWLLGRYAAAGRSQQTECLRQTGQNFFSSRRSGSFRLFFFVT